MSLLNTIILEFIIGFLITFLSVPFIKKLAKKYSLLDFPDKRKQHSKPVVRIGGLSLVIPFIILLGINYYSNDYFVSIGLENKYIFTILWGGALFFLIGFLDDLIGISPTKRLFFQSIISSLVISQGVKINTLYLDLSYFGLESQNINFNSFFSYIVSLIWIVGLVNAFNWLDGLDGLATGSAIIIATSIFIISLINYKYDILLITVLLIGNCLAFLFYNKMPSTILMGDGGSYFLGFIFAILSLLVSSDNFSIFSINYPLMMMLVPIGDMFFVILNRLRKRLSPFCPDRSHLHYKLIDLGFDHSQSVRQIYTYVIATSLISIDLQTDFFNGTIGCLGIMLLLLNFLIHQKKFISALKNNLWINK